MEHKYDNSEVRAIVRQAAREAVHETLAGLGIHANDQKDIQADLFYLRKIRKGSEFVGMRAKASVIAILIPSILYLIWEAVKQTIHK